MKFWLWLILLGAGGAATYLILSDTPSPHKASTSELKPQISEELQQDGDNQAPPSRAGNSVTETILPFEGGPKPARKEVMPQEDKLAALHPADDGDLKKDRDDDPDDLDAERELLMNSPRDLPRPARRAKSRTPDVAASSPSFVPTTPASLSTSPSTTASPSSSSSSTAGAAGSSGISGANLGGSFPALPAAASSPPASPSSSSGRTFSSASPSSAANAGNIKPSANKPANEPPAPAPNDGATNVAAKEIRADKPTDELIKPLNSETQKGPNDPEGANSATNAWIEVMKIPAGFSGLLLSPKSVAVAPLVMAAELDSQMPVTLVQGSTWKSSLDPAEKPSVQILKECPADPAAGECTPQPVTTGGPSVMDYLYNGAAHQEDQVPDSKDTFEIGTVVVGTQAECAFHIYPGTIPGKYQVLLNGKTAKLLGAFEVVAAASTVNPNQSPNQPLNQTVEPASLPRALLKAPTPNKAPEPH